jgi:transposase
VTDRYAGYHWLDVLQQQLCWARLICQLTDLSERPGAPQALTQAARAGTSVLRHRAYLRDHRAWLKAGLTRTATASASCSSTAPAAGTPRPEGVRSARFCTNLLNEYVTLWTFCEVPGIDPTNNAAERALRYGVILRNVSLGTQSDASRWIERICSVRETCRLQRRSVLAYLVDLTAAAQQHRLPRRLGARQTGPAPHPRAVAPLQTRPILLGT